MFCVNQNELRIMRSNRVDGPARLLWQGAPHTNVGTEKNILKKNFNK